MSQLKPERLAVLLGGESYTDHIIERPEETIDELIDELTDVEEFTAEKMLSMNLPMPIPGELMCSHGSKIGGEGLQTLQEYADEGGIDEMDFEADPPDGLCSYCWSNVGERLERETEQAEAGVYDRIGSVGYRMRWKQKGRAREEWYDIVVRPETTMAELDTLVSRFTTIDDYHLRMYGLEDEYLDSSISVVPDHQLMDGNDTKASELTIAELAERATLWEGDRLSLVQDFGTPSHFYCIVKEVYDPAELDEVLDASLDWREVISETDTAAIVDQKRP